LINFHMPLLEEGLHRILNLEFGTEVPTATFANLRAS
jgi:hypothetical protein